MAGDWRGFALEKAELLSGRLKDLLSSGQAYFSAQFGVDLGMKPEQYPTWFMLTTAAVGVLLLLGLSWAAVCGRLLVGKKRGSPVNVSSGEPGKAQLTKTVKLEEPKKRNKKKTPEKKTQSNGQPVAVSPEEVELVSKQSLPVKPQKVPDKQVPVQMKKDKKKTKAVAKPIQHLFTNEGKELDDGAWETKVSNREKRQQRRKDKGSETSGSPGGFEANKTHVESAVATAPTNIKKKRGSHESPNSRSSGKGDAASRPVSSSRREDTSVNGGEWSDFSLKIPAQMGTKWGTIPPSQHYRTQAEPQSWGGEAQAWTSIDGRIKTKLNPTSFSMLGLNTTDKMSKSVELQWTSHADVEDEWSGMNGVAAVDPSSDWNAPVEHWGNYEEPPVTGAPVPVQKEQPVPNKVLENEKDTGDSAEGAAKSKKRRKKKKKTEEEATSEAQMGNTAPLIRPATESQDLPVVGSKKQNLNISSQTEKSEEMVEPSKPPQRKKLQRET